MELSSLIRTRHRTIDPAKHRHVLFAVSEVAPFSKSGGLGDVAGALPAALTAFGHQVSVISPLYGHLDPERLNLSRRLRPLEVARKGLRNAKVEFIVWEGRHPNGTRLIFLQNDDYFDRDHLYGYDDTAYEDNAERFAIFSRAIVEYARAASRPFDIIHANDWHTALVGVYARHYYEQEFDRTAFVLTIHNLAYQGSFPLEQFDVTGLPKSKFLKSGQLLNEDKSEVNFLRAGILHSDKITTVSPTYAREILDPERAFGLGETLSTRRGELQGILNGVDYQVWSPEVDRQIAVTYDVEDLNGKRRNKAELQHLYELPVRPVLPVLGFIGRLTEQKSVDLIVEALSALLETFTSEREGFQVVFLGEGDGKLKRALLELKAQFPRRVGVRIGYEEELAHRIQAGADVLLVPSRFEPCGLTQIYALRYGTLPLVHATGGLADTVVDASRGSDQGTGFVFDELSVESLKETIMRATSSYRQYRKWRPLMVNAMEQNFSWESAAVHYNAAYQQALDDLDTRD